MTEPQPTPVTPDLGIGEPTSPERLRHRLCGFKSTLPQQAGEVCDETATLHVLVRHRELGTPHHLLSCSGHYTVAIQTGELVADHKIGPWCARPDTVFDTTLNVCAPDVTEESWTP